MKSGFNKILNNLLKNKTDSVSSKLPLTKYFTLGIVGISAFLIIIVIIITIIFAPIMMAQQYIEDVKNKVSLFFEKVGNVLTLNGWCADSDGSCQRKAEQKYYQKLDEIYTDYKEKGVEIDTQLLTGTIFYGNTLSEDKFQNEDIDSSDSDELIDGTDIHLGDVKTLAKNMVNGNRIDYEKYRKYLVDTYIPKRFREMYDEQDAKKAIERIADEIMSFSSNYIQIAESPSTNYGSCRYDISGNNIDASNLQVVLVSCDGTKELERVDFEQYIKGVVYGEVGNVWPDEVLKAQAVAARSYTLTRNQTLCPGRPNDCEYGYNPKKNEIRMRNCEGDQVYCDYKQGCQKYNYNGYNSLISGTKNPTLQVYKPPLSETDAEHFENNLNNVNGKVLINENNTIYASSYIDVDQRAWNSMYNTNNSLDYNDILIKHYWNKTNSNLTINSSCSNYGSAGEYSEWKQFDPRWNKINIGLDTIGNSGCLVTSISIQLARSNTVTLTEFNPGIFANELTKRGGFSLYGALMWDPLRTTINEITNGKFQAVNLDYSLYGTKQNKINMLKQLINSGNLLVLGVKNEGHWVAIDRIENDNVYIFDPGDSYVTEVTQKYDWGGVTKVQIYNVVP